MPELDRNYLAGLYLDEITLDVMPQEYIDAALEVKLRYDACAPRAGYNCVQDRRVKGGFYYRKAPQGKGVNALPPSRLERALARSQEQPTQRSGMGFLSKAAIGAGVAIGGLALTGAVVNAGRSSEPYQEPVRQRPSPPPSNNTARNVGVGVGAAATVGLSVGAAIANKQQSKPEPQTIPPQQSAQVPRSPDPVKTPEEEEGYREERRRIQAITELSRVGYDVQRRAYEQALSKDLEKAGVTPEGIEQKKKNLQFDDENEGFVRIDQVKENTADGVQLTKAARAKQSEDLQALYDKLKDNGVEDAIEFRPAIDKKFKKPLAASANKYTVDLRDGNPPVQVGEMRFRKNKDQIIGAIAEKMKPEVARSQPPEKSAKPPKPEAETPRSTTKAEAPKRALVDDLSAKLSRAISDDGFVAQSGLISELRKKPQYKDVDIDQEIESLAKDGGGRIQLVTDKYGKTLVRDLDQVKTEKLVSEAKKLTDPTSDRKRLLENALEYKEARATNEDERVGVANLRDAIAGIQEVKPSDRGGKKPPEPRPDNEGGEGGGKRGRGESAKMKAAAEKLKEQNTLKNDPPIATRSEEQIAADRIAEDQAKQAKKQKVGQSRNEGRAEERAASDAENILIRRQRKELNDEEFNLEVERVRKLPVVVRAVTEAIAPTAEDYQKRVNSAKTTEEAIALQAQGREIMEQQARDVYDRFKIPELIEIAPKAKEVPTSSADKSPLVKAPTPEPNTPAPKAASEGNTAAAVKSPLTAAEKRQKKQQAYIKKLDTVVAGDWVKDPFADRYSSNARKKATDKDASLGITIQKEDDGWMVYTDEHEPEDLAEMFGGRNKDKTRFFSLEQAKEAAGEFAEYYEGLVQEDKGREAVTPPLITSKPVSEKKTRSRKKASQSVSTASSKTAKVEPVDLRTLQSNIDKMQTTADDLQKGLERVGAGKDLSESTKAALLNMGVNIVAFEKLTPEAKTKKIEKAIAYQKEQIQKKQQEGFDYIDSLKNDAIALSEIYLATYWETRNKYRRAS